MAYKRFKVRLFPNKHQEEMFWKHINACRWIWNYMIDYQKLNKEILNSHLTDIGLSNLITILKIDDDFSWLKEVSRHSLVMTCKDLWRVYDRHHKNLSNLPKYKSKKYSKPVFPVRDDHNATYFKSADRIQIPKCGKVKCRFDYRKYSIDLEEIKLLDPRIYLSNNGKWILSFAANIEDIDNQDFMFFNSVSLGIDMGVQKLATISYIDMSGKVNYEVLKNINKSKKIRQIDSRIKHTQRAIRRKIRCAKRYGYNIFESKRYWKCRAKYKKLLFRKINIIEDLYDKFTSHIVYDLRPSIIWLEELSIKKFLSKARRPLPSVLKYCKWGLFRRMIEYKASSIGISVMYVPRNFPSSQICSSCGSKKKLDLRDRFYVCDCCGMIMDRDENAAKNLMRYVDYRNKDYPIIYQDKHI